MNYDDHNHQQQQFYMQQTGMQNSQTQRMTTPLVQQQYNQHQPTMQHQIMRPHYGMVHPHMVRMSNQGEDSSGHYQQQSHIREMQFPPHVQNRDSDRKKQIEQAHAQAAMKQQFEQMQQQQNGVGMRTINMPPQRMSVPQANTLIYAGAGGKQMVVQQPASSQIQRIPSQGSFIPGQSPAGQNFQQTMQMHSQQMGPTRASMPVKSYLQQQQAFSQQAYSQKMGGQQQTIQIQQQLHKLPIPTGSPQSHPQKIEAVIGQIPHQIRKNQNIQLSGKPSNAEAADSEKNAIDAPISGTGTQSIQQEEAENPEYKALLERLRTYHSDVKRLLDRLNTDYPGEMKLKSSLINVVYVMEGTRKSGVNRELLRKLLSNVQTVLDQYKITRHLLTAAKKLASKPPTKTIVKEQIFPDPWKEVRHLQIRIPSHLLEDGWKYGQANARVQDVTQRPIIKDLDEPPTTKRSLLTAMAESFSVPKKDQEDSVDSIKSYQVVCMDGLLTLNSALSASLDRAKQRGFSIDFDKDCAPISNNPSTHTVQVQLLFQQNNYHGKFPPLNLLLPTDYPKNPVEILPTAFEPSTIVAPMDDFLERIDSGIVDTHSMDELLEAWIDCLSNSGIIQGNTW